MSKVKKLVLSMIVILFVMGLVVHIGPLNGIIGDYAGSDYDTFEIPSFVTYELSPKDEFTQTFIPKYDYTTEFYMVLLNIDDNSTGKLYYKIIDGNGKLILEKKRELSDIKAGEWIHFAIDKKLKQGQVYSLTFTVTDTEKNPMLMVINSVFDKEENVQAYYDQQPIAGGLLSVFGYMESRTMMFRIMVCFLLLIFGIFVLFMIHVKEPLEKLKTFFIENGDIKKTVYYILLFFLGLLITFLHCYKLHEIPYGIHVDEMGSGYDAYCIANWGVDRFRMSFPVYFTNIGTGQNALYTYMAAVLFKIFGYSETLLRVPAVIDAYMLVFFGAAIAYRKWKSRNSVLILISLFSMLPFFTMSTRFGLESYLLMGFGAMFIYTLIRAVEQNSLMWYIISGICCGIVLYTYALVYLVMIVFLVIGLYYLIRLKKITWKQIIGFAVPLGIFAMPLVLCQIINIFDLPEIKIGLITITKLQGYRGNEIIFNHMFANLLQCLKNIFWHDDLNYNAFPEYMTMYWVSIPIFIIGFCYAVNETVQSFRKHEWNISFVMLVWFLCTLAMGCLLGGYGPNCNKLNGIYISVIYFIVEGLLVSAQMCTRENWCKWAMAICITSYIINFVSFTDYYFNVYTEECYPEYLFEPTYTEALSMLNSLEPEIADRKTYIDEYSEIYFCGSTLISPYDIDYGESKGGYDKYDFICSTHVEEDANFILRDCNKSFAIELEKAGFIVQQAGAWLVCYYPS